MVVELICVGTELLLGNIVNTNAAFLSEQCAALGLSNYYQTVVGDNEERLKGVIKTAIERSDIVILSGGLGPTKDDLTKETAAAVLGKKLKLHEPSKKKIQDFFEKRKITPTENNWKQAMAPEGAIVVENENGTAPGFIIEEGEKALILLPGPPNELLPMFEKSIKPYLKEKEPGIILSQTIKICGLGESYVETMIQDMIEKQENPTIAPYAKTGEVHLRATARAKSEKEAKKLLKPMIKELKSRIGGYIYTTEEKVTLEMAVIDLLKNNHLTLTTAESCTGGMIVSRLINVQGASDVVREGLVTYSNKAKRKYLGVKKGTLAKKGAVSEETAKEMAKGGVFFTKSDVCIATTGIAGPGGGSEEKPVGLVYIGCNVCGKITVKKYQFGGGREKIRQSATAAALTLLRQCVLEYYSKVTFGKEKKEK